MNEINSKKYLEKLEIEKHKKALIELEMKLKEMDIKNAYLKGRWHWPSTIDESEQQQDQLAREYEEEENK